MGIAAQAPQPSQPKLEPRPSAAPALIACASLPRKKSSRPPKDVLTGETAVEVELVDKVKRYGAEQAQQGGEILAHLRW